jgi:AraC-like DNA-binding protein
MLAGAASNCKRASPTAVAASRAGACSTAMTAAPACQKSIGTNATRVSSAPGNSSTATIPGCLLWWTLPGAANLSPSRLAGLFKEQCGLSVLGYRDELRMSHAARLLNDSAMGIAEIGGGGGLSRPGLLFANLQPPPGRIAAQLPTFKKGHHTTPGLTSLPKSLSLIMVNALCFAPCCPGAPAVRPAL